jgi:hypothetical protein
MERSSLHLPLEQVKLSALPTRNEALSIPGSHARLIPVESQ